MKVAKLRNTKFTNTLFNQLTFSIKVPKSTKKEGYRKTKWNMSFPMMEQDPHNAYSHVCTGWSKPIKEVDFQYYDQKLHEQYKKYVNGGCFNQAVIYSNSFTNAIYLVDFENCTFIKTNLNMELIKVKLLNSTFNDGKIIGHEIINSNIISGKFINSEINTTFKDCKLKDVTFENCNVKINNIYSCYENVTFIDCTVKHNIIEYKHPKEDSIHYVNCQIE